MASHRISIHSTRAARAFTLVEILIVIGLVGMVAAFGMFMSWESYGATSFISDRDILVSALHRARAQAISNMCFDVSCTDGVPHGVHVDAVNHVYTVFEGSSYATRHPIVDQEYEGTLNVTVVGSIEIVFSELSGTATPANIALTSATGRSSTIYVSSEGRIAWTQ